MPRPKRKDKGKPKAPAKSIAGASGSRGGIDYSKFDSIRCSDSEEEQEHSDGSSSNARACQCPACQTGQSLASAVASEMFNHLLRNASGAAQTDVDEFSGDVTESFMQTIAARLASGTHVGSHTPEGSVPCGKAVSHNSNVKDDSADEEDDDGPPPLVESGDEGGDEADSEPPDLLSDADVSEEGEYVVAFPGAKSHIEGVQSRLLRTLLSIFLSIDICRF
jgi:hypothetical protein